MTRVNKAKEVASYLNSAYPPTNSFLHYKKDWELLFAVILSAQATDKSVNEATEHLFAQYPDLKDFTAANLEGILKCIRHVGLGKSKVKYLIETSSILLNNNALNSVSNMIGENKTINTTESLSFTLDHFSSS